MVLSLPSCPFKEDGICHVSCIAWDSKAFKNCLRMDNQRRIADSLEYIKQLITDEK